MSWIEFAFRIVIIASCLYNLCWSANGPAAFMKGEFRAPYYYMSFVFFGSSTTLSYEAWHFIKPGDDLWRMMLLSLSTVTNVIGIIGHRVGAPLMTGKFQIIYKALPHALAIATLAEYDPEAAKRLNDECWKIIRQSTIAGIEPNDA